jgi:gliding motility-associated lipoprotein GldH
MAPKYVIHFVSILAIVTLACNRNVVFEKNEAIVGHSWDIGDTLSFIAHIPDSAVFYDIYINVRNGGAYAYSNLFLFLQVQAPSGGQVTDTVEIALANNRGEWFGKGLGDMFFLSAPYRHNVKFALPGIYQFRMVQGMREQSLEEIYDMGLRIEKSAQSSKNQ